MIFSANLTTAHRVIAAAVCCLMAALLLAAKPASAACETSRCWLSKIMMCESGGDPTAVNESRTEQHSNGQIGSYGLFQFGVPTWQYAVKAAHDINLGKKEWIEWIHVYPDAAPENVQWAMAILIWDDGEGARHWHNCANAVGYAAVTPEEAEQPKTDVAVPLQGVEP